MDARFRRLVFVLLMFAASHGCATPAALRRQTVHQGDTVADIHQQQVLDNLAKFVVDPYSIPSFAVAASGSANVDDQCTGGLGLSWMNSGFDAANLSIGGQRSQGASWVTVPIADPRKLELMRCAYQRVLTRCGCFPVESTSCPDCAKRFNSFYTGHPYATDTTKDGQTCYDCENGQLTNLVSPPVDDPCACHDCDCPDDSNSSIASNCESCPTPGDGIVNSECLSCDNGQWFCWSKNAKCVPKGCGCVGQYCGMYVWVPCGPGRDELAKLTLAILDYAVHDDAELPTKQIEAYLDCKLQPTTSDKAVYTITAQVNLDESTNTIHMGDGIEKVCQAVPLTNETGKGLRSMGAKSSAPRPVPRARATSRRSPMPGAAIPFEQQLLNNL